MYVCAYIHIHTHIHTPYIHTYTICGKPNSYKQWFMLWISASHYFIFISRTIHFPNKVLCGITTYIMNKRRGNFLEIGRKSGGSWSPTTWLPSHLAAPNTSLKQKASMKQSWNFCCLSFYWQLQNSSVLFKEFYWDRSRTMKCTHVKCIM